ncbi:diacylglycerol kinase [Photobacterium iliopiscarium]|nr:diacylglycerol kinase [Photobacterium iliopiscarium]
MKPGATGLQRIIDATGYSMQGLKAAWINEAAFRQESILLVVMTVISFFMPVTKLERLMMISSLFIVVIAELVNSAIEAVVDRIGPEHHELSGRAKDIGSAAVFVALVMVAIIWGSIFIFYSHSLIEL